MSAAVLHYIHDPLCRWCYGAACATAARCSTRRRRPPPCWQPTRWPGAGWTCSRASRPRTTWRAGASPMRPCSRTWRWRWAWSTRPSRQPSSACRVRPRSSTWPTAAACSPAWAEHKRGLVRLLTPLLEAAEQHGVVMAIENHIDLLANEMLDLVTTLGSPWIGVCFDTANNLRMFEHPVAVAEKLAPYVKATHIKDVVAQRGDPKLFKTWPSVPLGQGLVELPEILQVLHRANYRGLLAVEIDYLHPSYRDAQRDEESALIQSLAYLKQAVQDASSKV